MNKIAVPKSTCLLIDADVAFFPLNPSTSFTQFLNQLPSDVDEQTLVGIAELPPVVPRKLNHSWNNATIGKGISKRKVAFGLFGSKERMSEKRLDEYWHETITHIQKKPNPAVWIIAPKWFCDYLYLNYCQDTGGNFYYHNPASEDTHFHYLITNSDLPKAHLISFILN